MRVCLGPGFSYGSAGKESTCNAGDLALIPGLGRSPGEGKGYPLQYSGLENSMDCIVHGVAKSQTWLSDFHCTGPAFNRGTSLSQSNTEIPVPSWLFLVKGEISPQTCICGMSISQVDRTETLRCEWARAVGEGQPFQTPCLLVCKGKGRDRGLKKK